jgi:phosphoglycerate dehydrogenase-like enzyme
VDPKSEEVADRLGQAEVIVGFPKIESLAQAAKLRWVQLGSAGADRFYDSMPPEVILTNASGTYGKCIAEHILAMMLSLTRGIAWMVRAQSQNRWQRQFRWTEVSGATMGIIGLGDIGLETAKRAKALEMHVLANKRTPEDKPDFVDELYGLEGLEQILNRSDHVVLTVPGVPSTKEMIGPEQFEAMKEGAYFYNVGRGSTVDEAALVDALKSGKLAGAGLDVFQQEPLEEDSPLWQMENVILSPHVAGSTQYGARRIGEIFLENLSRYVAGKEMINVVDRELGY